MMSMASSTVGDAMNYIEDTIGEKLEKTAIKVKSKGHAVAAALSIPAMVALYNTEWYQDHGRDFRRRRHWKNEREKGEIKKKVLAAAAALGLAGATGYGIHRMTEDGGESKREKKANIGGGIAQLGRAIAKHKRPVIGATVGVPVLAALASSAREADRKAGGIPQALDNTMDNLDAGLDEVDRIMDEGLSDKQKALAALGTLGLAGVGGYKAYKSLSGKSKGG